MNQFLTHLNSFFLLGRNFFLANNRQTITYNCWLHTETKLVLSKNLIQVHLEISSRFVENMASHMLTKSITWWSKSCQSLCWLESWNRCTCTSCTWLPLLIGQLCSQVWCRASFEANFGFFELRTLPWSPRKVEVGTIYPFTLKVASKYTYILLRSSSVKPTTLRR